VGACAASVVLVVAGTPSAVAAKGDKDPEPKQAFPSARDVRVAKQEAGDTAALVDKAQADLVTANAELEAAAVRAEQAAEAWNGAQWRLQEATHAAHEARADVRRSDRKLADQRDDLAGVVAASYQDGGDVAAVNAVLGSEGPQGLMSQMLAYQGASSSMDAQFQKYGATAALAKVFRAQAEKAEAERKDLLAEAEQARQEAESAAAAAQTAASSIATRKDALVQQLAELEGISVTLAAKRQAALEEIERKKREAEAAAAAAAAEAAAEAAAQAQAQAEAEAQAQQDEQEDSATPSAPSTPPAPITPPATNGGAAAAIAFARAQLGEPYQWGAAGPSSWDCSGLMMGAWAQGGVSLPHYSAAQYAASTPISSSQLRPGDLVFWGTTSSPASIHHVAMYLGNGMIIHAPRTGRPVSIDSMYYWIPPNFFGRV
jgi:cell wall-associated NlpC family hydrolase